MIAFGLIALAVVALIVLLLVYKSLYLVHQAEVIIVERLGRFNRVLEPGLNVLIPFIDTPRSVTWSHVTAVDTKKHYKYIKTIYRIDLREGVYDFPKQNVITRDNIMLEINAIVYYHISDPKAAVYEVFDLPEAIEKLAQTTLRNVIGSMDLDETLVSRDAINERLRATLDEAADKWGVKVTRVELQEVNPPFDIRAAMEKQMRAERDRRAIILEAEGAKTAAVLRAEGEQEAAVRTARGVADSAVINAQGEAEAKLKVAEAEAQLLDMLKQRLPDSELVQYLIAQQYIKMMPKLTDGQNNKLVVLPYEATGVMGSLAGIKELFKQDA